MSTFNIYCDESCHLENDHQPSMVLGAIWSNSIEARNLSKKIRALKIKHGLSPLFEIKWTKVSPAKIDFYLELIQFFFDEENLHFRALIIPDKTKLCHELFNQDHDTWYYKMYFELLKPMLSPCDHYRIYIDRKDTCSSLKIRKLHEVLSNNRLIIEKIQNVHSHEIEQMQIADLLIGCVLAANRPRRVMTAKKQLVDKVRELSGYCLTKTTVLKEEKVNLFHWSACEIH